MSVQDMIKKSVLESGMFSQYDIPKILAALAVALILGSVIYLVYQKFYVGVIFSRSFAVTLVGMTVLTCMVTLAISSNIVISLGMVGALSIVRFRTAIKDPMDLLYLFWAITSDYSRCRYVCINSVDSCDYHSDDHPVLSQTTKWKNLYCSDSLSGNSGGR